MNNPFITALVLILLTPVFALLSKRYKRLRPVDPKSQLNVFDFLFVLCVVLSFVSGLVGLIEITVSLAMGGAGS